MTAIDTVPESYPKLDEVIKGVVGPYNEVLDMYVINYIHDNTKRQTHLIANGHKLHFEQSVSFTMNENDRAVLNTFPALGEVIEGIIGADLGPLNVYVINYTYNNVSHIVHLLKGDKKLEIKQKVHFSINEKNLADLVPK